MRSLDQLTDFVQQVLFTSREDTPGRLATLAALTALFCVGVLHWTIFLAYGELSFRGGDWPKEYRYYSVLQQALQTGTIPYHIDQVIQNTQRFLAIPETLKSPQVLLLAFVSIGQFVLINTLIMYAVGFVGCLLIRRHYRLSLFAFTVLFLLFNFNGHITSHLSTGHSMWTGYFLMPFYCYCVLRLCEGSGGTPLDDRLALGLALILFAMNLQGAFHMFVWNVLFLGLLAIFNLRYVRPLTRAVVYSGLLSSFIVLPAAITYWGAERAFLTGYPTLSVLVQAFVSIRQFDIRTSPATALVGDVGWWEYDLFIGALALAALVYLGIWLRCCPPQSLKPALTGTEYRPLDGPMALMTLFSLGAFYALIAMLPLPLLNSERTPSRFLITPFLLLLVVSCLRLDRILRQRVDERAGLSPLLAGGMLAATAQTGFELATHSKAWSVEKWDPFYADTDFDFAIGIERQVDPTYEWSLPVSLAISAATLLLWGYRYAAALAVPPRYGSSGVTS